MAFVQRCEEVIGPVDSMRGEFTPDRMEEAVRWAFGEAAAEVLPERKAKAHRPWITDATLALIEQRDEARMRKDWRAEA